ncbi:MAG: RNA polymerase sigma factor [Pseudomonadota bacterium]
MEQVSSTDVFENQVQGFFPCAKHKIQEHDLVHEYRDKLVRMLTRLTRNPDRAEDLAQETLMVVIDGLRKGSIQKLDSLPAFMFSTARYLHIGWLRKLENKIELQESLEELPSQSGDASLEIENEELREYIANCINQLSMPRDRELLVRRYINDQSKPEICNALDLTENHYDRVMSRARQRLKARINQLDQVSV